MPSSRSDNRDHNSSASIGFEAKLWLAADKLRSNMDPAEYKHVVLGLIFLKYISDSFEEHHAKLIESKEISMDGHAGLEFTGESDQASFKSRVYLFGNRVHQIGVAVFKGKDDAANVDRFFGSFSFTKS